MLRLRLILLSAVVLAAQCALAQPMPPARPMELAEPPPKQAPGQGLGPPPVHTPAAPNGEQPSDGCLAKLRAAGWVADPAKPAGGKSECYVAEPVAVRRFRIRDQLI